MQEFNYELNENSGNPACFFPAERAGGDPCPSRKNTPRVSGDSLECPIASDAALPDSECRCMPPDLPPGAPRCVNCGEIVEPVPRPDEHHFGGATLRHAHDLRLVGCGDGLDENGEGMRAELPPLPDRVPGATLDDRPLPAAWGDFRRNVRHVVATINERGDEIADNIVRTMREARERRGQ